MVVFIREPTLALFDNTFVTHMDDFATHNIHNLLTNNYLRKESIKEEYMIKNIEKQKRTTEISTYE